MYESFFQLRQRPFAAAPRVDRYFPATAIESARSALVRGIDGAEGAGLLVGPSGTGKTLVCHLLAERFRDRFVVAMLSNGHLDSRRELLQAVLFELGLPYRRLEEGELRLSLIDYISNEQNAREGLLLLVDEAHTLPPRLLEELRLIANLVRNGRPRARLVLSGGPSLEETLADPALEALNQRVSTRCYLSGLDHAQTQQYVLAQLNAVGARHRELFSSDALEAIFLATDGIPRLINQVCDHALMLAFAGGRRQISRAGIEEAWSDLQQLPTPWGQSSRQDVHLETGAAASIEFGELEDEPEPFADQHAAIDEELFSPGGSVGAAAEATLLLHQIDDHLSALDHDFAPAPPADSLAGFSTLSDPFRESFDHEELLVDRYSSLGTEAFPGHHQVASEEGRRLSAMLESFVQESTPALTVVKHAPRTEPELFVSSAAAAGWFQSTTADVQQYSAASKLSADSAAIDVGTSGKAEQLEPLHASRPSTSVPRVLDPSATLEADDDMMIVEDDPRPEIRMHTPGQARQVRRQEFRQLFSSLRRG